MNVELVPIDRVIPDPNQPRKAFKQSDLEELAASIKEHGILQPLTVSERVDTIWCQDHPDKRTKCEGHEAFVYPLIAGERRLRAAKLAGLDKVPVIIREFTEEVTKVIQILENVARSDLNPMEEAEAFAELVELGLSSEAVAPKVGKSHAYVVARMSLMRLDPSLQGLVRSGQMNSTTAATLAKLTGEKQHQAAKAWLDNGLSTAALAKLVDHLEVEQDEMFTQDEVPARRKEVIAARERIDRAMDAAADALRSLVDKRTLELLPEAVEGDVPMLLSKLAMLEKNVASLRAEVEASAARKSKGLWDEGL